MNIIKDIEYDQYYTHDIVESKYTQCSLNQNIKHENVKKEEKEEKKKEIFKTL